MNITYKPIGYLHTPHKNVTGMPVQPSGAKGVHGTLTVLPEFREGLKDIDGFSYLIVLYHLHEICGQELTVTPFLDTNPHGIFATRSPKRPNSLGLSVMKLLEVENGVLLLDNVDVLDGTPVIDIKPYVPDFDVWPAERVGWFEGKSGNATTKRSDSRFANPEPVCVEE
ncbi:tRNA (N6-threonylcarbamoyladenosine(37)-N6)-methyltransferase TrmO [Pseudodesulfovibrio cashew]|uniref:tRNA (N6-threonylcarbamoyladenosine(37)-N6)-methyltransferase TrmO n=1 Tax=Pseudodesulfovibrio cashew TaxID=2678688 RepID=A0A6I6JGP7_9BACT|nr:tRNA (N6-threonylcarbamoyladenosine(37)-N6)-methyltransferase TrmO [Pseudodesulfovibrio cashew]QGY39542.1 tRNA (N6-threonylcarbamoyladenosine(37)-N6)-methyltransferase TrmO [Pseudodesulfovibrio cashew]